MLSTMAQYLSARQTMTASRQVGIWRKVRGHMWLAMMFCSFFVMPNTRYAFTQADPGWEKPCISNRCRRPWKEPCLCQS